MMGHPSGFWCSFAYWRKARAWAFLEGAILGAAAAAVGCLWVVR